jgi:CRP/FNR family cyclic AMP-dependent transcriptional regulator
MIKKFLRKLTQRFADWNLSATEHPESPIFLMAADMLRAPSALMQLTKDEARVVVRYMRPRKIAEGTVFIREGDTLETGFMALILEGEVTVESIVVSTDLLCAILTRENMLELLQNTPEICAKLLIVISMRMGERLRDNTEKLKKYAQLTKAMQQEIDHLMPI